MKQSHIAYHLYLKQFQFFQEEASSSKEKEKTEEKVPQMPRKEVIMISRANNFKLVYL